MTDIELVKKFLVAHKKALNKKLEKESKPWSLQDFSRGQLSAYADVLGFIEDFKEDDTQSLVCDEHQHLNDDWQFNGARSPGDKQPE